ncbi:hypothetical protein T492DRAFT_838459 [Pavlovales sp. CCMP2436]|nr:hypothetical protein T492DRAFT_838459 [Pavlovales sp. CCMP2436]
MSQLALAARIFFFGLGVTSPNLAPPLAQAGLDSGGEWLSNLWALPDPAELLRAPRAAALGLAAADAAARGGAAELDAAGEAEAVLAKQLEGPRALGGMLAELALLGLLTGSALEARPPTGTPF